MTDWTFVTLVVLCAFKSLHAATPGTRLTVTKTCHHVYGTFLYTTQSIQTPIACAMQCTRLSTCRSVLYQAASSTCMLNNNTVDIESLPEDCGVIYMDYKPVELPTDGPASQCDTSTSCNVNGSVCVDGSCQCDFGLIFDPDAVVCSSTLNRAVCELGDRCFVANYGAARPWKEDEDHLKVTMDCNVTFPYASIAAGELGIAIITNVPADVQPFNYRNVTHISTTETIFTNANGVTSPFLFKYQTVYFGHIISWNNTVPIYDVPPAEAQCRLIY